MKILIVNKFLYANGGSETYIFNLGKQLENMGNEIQYFGMDHPNKIVGNQWNCYTGNMDFHSGKWGRILYPFKIIFSYEAYSKILFVLKKFDPDAVHINNFNFQLTPSILYAIKYWEKQRKRKLPIIMTAHDSQLVCPNHLMMIPSTGEICFKCEGGKFGYCVKNKCIHNSEIRSLLASFEGLVYRLLRTYRKIDLLVCPSIFMKKKLSTNKDLAEKAVVMHNFVERKMDIRVIKKDNYILYFGRYSKEKGIETLLNICREMPDVPFVFAGDGPLKEEVCNLPNIIEKGFLTGEELYDTIARARLVVFPSECNENCPLSVMEAQIYGTPVFGSRIGGIPELIQDGINGRLLEAGNVEEWKSAIYNIWSDASKLDEYAANCQKVEYQTAEQYCKSLLQKIQGLMGE